MEWLIPLVVGLCLLTATSLVIAAYACHRAINAEIQVKGLQASTHQIQFVPAEPPSTAELAEERELNAEFDKAERAAMRRVHDIHDESEPLM